MGHADIYLVDYVTGKLEPELRLRVEAHLRDCLKCQQGLEDVSYTFQYAGKVQHSTPASQYFSSIIPHVRERLENRTQWSWTDNPVFSKLALPLGAAAVALALLMNIAQFGPANGSVNPLSPIFYGIEPEDVVDMVVEESPPTPWTTRQTQDVAQAVVGDHLTRGHFLQDALTLDVQPYFYELSTISSQQLLQNFDEAQVEAILKKLEERGTL
ncbi:MAG: zf-HC2 domain-containing protein [Ignavibacteriales bacterium]|nr:zf-HC2 domain-containing protein [Ignavibacteriales bacterium]